MLQKDSSSNENAIDCSVASKNITVIIQGDIREKTSDCIDSVSRILPKAELILSTYEGDEVPSGFEGRVIRVADPGSHAPVTRSLKSPRSNINRQIATSQAGLAAATRPFALKIRSDAVLHSDKMMRVWAAVKKADPEASRLVAPSFFSRNPLGISGYLFHASDWVMFGTTERMKSYWDVPYMNDQTTTWFDTRRHRLMSTLSARRMRSRLTPEQHLTIHFAKKLGYQTPEFFNDRSRTLIRECERFYAREMVIAAPQDLGLTLPKYTAITNSLFQRVDNIFFEDWLRMCYTHAPQAVFEMPSLRRSRMQMMLRRALFYPIFATRHIISIGALYSIRRRRLKAERAASKRA